jgi:hypothetical protein
MIIKSPRLDRQPAARSSSPRLRRMAVVVPAGLTAAGLLASGCATASSQNHSASAGGHSPPAAAGHQAANATAGQETSAGATAASAAGSSARCTADALRLSAGTGTGAAGSTYYSLNFTNVSRSTCTLDGYPGVSLVAGGPQRSELGRPAFRTDAVASHVVSLSPGSTAHADLRVQLAENYPAAICKPVSAHWLRVYPPESATPLYLSFSAVTCTGHVPSGSTIGIDTVQPGA